MRSGQDLMEALMETLADTRAENARLLNAGIAKAKAERDYRIALAKREIELRADGQPVTLTQDLAKGDPAVAALRFERDVAASTWEQVRQNAWLLSAEARIIEAQVGREWGTR